MAYWATVAVAPFLLRYPLIRYPVEIIDLLLRLNMFLLLHAVIRWVFHGLSVLAGQGTFVMTMSGEGSVHFAVEQAQMSQYFTRSNGRIFFNRADLVARRASRRYLVYCSV